MQAAELPPLRTVIEQFDLAPKKSLGQHFLLDTNLLAKIVRGAGDISSTHVIEIGPGPGGLTRAILAANPRHLTAVEKDSRCIAALAPLKEIYRENFTLLEADALTLDISSLNLPLQEGVDGNKNFASVHLAREVTSTQPSPFQGEGSVPRAVIANLPYNVGTALVIDWLKAVAAEGPRALTSFTVMLQKEVAERMVADVGDDAYGRLAVIMKQYTDAMILFDVPAGAFTPPPKVTSAILHARILATPREHVPLAALEKVVAAAFNHRRKMLRQSLKSISANPVAWCEQAGIDPTLRAEACDLTMFANLARIYSRLP